MENTRIQNTTYNEIHATKDEIHKMVVKLVKWTSSPSCGITWSFISKAGSQSLGTSCCACTAPMIKPDSRSDNHMNEENTAQGHNMKQTFWIFRRIVEHDAGPQKNMSPSPFQTSNYFGLDYWTGRNHPFRSILCASSSAWYDPHWHSLCYYHRRRDLNFCLRLSKESAHVLVISNDNDIL